MKFRDLPLEIMHYILRQATDTNTVSHENYEPLGFIERSRRFETALTDVRPTILSLNLVSKALHSLTEPFLYENVVIVQASRLQQLNDMLAQAPNRGRWVKRLVLNTTQNGLTEDPPVIRALEDILSRCPSLMVLGVTFCWRRMGGGKSHSRYPRLRGVPMHDSTFSTICNLYCTSLQSLQLGFTHMPASLLVAVLGKLPKLRTLSLRWVGDDDEDDPHAKQEEGRKDVPLPSLHSLTIQHGGHLPLELAMWALPALQHVAIPFTISSRPWEGLIPLLSRHSQQISTLEIGSTDDDESLAYGYEDSSVDMHSLLSQLPVVKHLILRNSESSSSIIRGTQHANITAITVFDFQQYWLAGIAEDDPWVIPDQEYVIKHLEEGHLPALKKIRICFYDDVDPHVVVVDRIADFNRLGVEWEIATIVDGVINGWEEGG